MSTPLVSLEQYHNLLRKPRKYRNEPTCIDGRRFASKSEAWRYKDLLVLEKARQISALKLQPRFKLAVNGIHICDYVADFEYYEAGVRVVEDYKGYRTRDYRLKKRLMKAVFGIEVRET